MRKYKFRLEKLLKYRKISEDKQSQELLRKIKELNERKHQLNLIKSEKQKSSGEFTQAQLDGIKGNHISVYKNYLNSLAEKKEKQKIKTSKSEEVVETARQDYLEARKKLDSTEKFKERDFQRYRNEMRRSEQKRLDEVAANQYNAENGKEVKG